ncbi:MAG: pentapeptide repeat-containing protein [Cyanobacteriota bacterium]
MTHNLALGNIRIIFQGDKPFSIGQIGTIFNFIENIYTRFSDQIFESQDLCLIINNVKNEIAAFDLVASTKDNKPIKFSDFEELTMCVLYSIYSSTFEHNLEIYDKKAESIYNNVFNLLDIIQENQSLLMSSAIDNKLVKISILPNRKVSLDKYDSLNLITMFKNKEDVVNAYQTDKLDSFINSNMDEFDLSDINLSGANFVDSSLYKVNLNNSNISKANFFNSDLSEASLIKTNLTYSTLEEADLSGSNLAESDLSETNLSNADFSGTKLCNARFHNVTVLGTDFSSSDLTGALFSGDITFDSDTDFSNKANWWDAKIENEIFKKWLEKNYPKR